MKKLLSVLLTVLAVTPLYSNNINWSSPPTTLSSGLFNTSDPQIAIDANGDVVATWAENNLIMSSSKPAGGNWSTEVTLSLTGASMPRLVSDSNGNATAIWLENGVIKAASKPSGGNWSTSTTLSSASATSPFLCVDSAGDVVAVWSRAGNIESSTKLFGANWQNHVTITSTGAATPVVAIGSTGANTRAVVVWQGTSGSTNVIYTSTKLISGSWSTQQIISETTHNALLPWAAVDANGNATAIWYSYDVTGSSFTNVTVKSAERSISTGTWSGVTAISSSGLRNPSTLIARVAYDSTGNAIALWSTSFDDETFNIEAAVNPVNGNWSTPVDLVSSNIYAYTSDLAATNFGDVLALYMFYNGTSLLIQSTESDMNGFLNNIWSVPVIVSQHNDNAFPRIAAVLNGNTLHAAAVWLNYNGTKTLTTATTGSKTLVLPPSNLSATQSSNNFGVFTEYFNTLRWTASTDPTVVGYLIFRNGQFVAQVGANITQFVDDNRAQNGAVTYGVTAINSQQAQSTTVILNFL